MEEKPLTHYQKYKSTILKSKQKWIDKNPENKERAKQWCREASYRRYLREKEMLQKFKELEENKKN